MRVRGADRPRSRMIHRRRRLPTTNEMPGTDRDGKWGACQAALRLQRSGWIPVVPTRGPVSTQMRTLQLQTASLPVMTGLRARSPHSALPQARQLALAPRCRVDRARGRRRTYTSAQEPQRLTLDRRLTSEDVTRGPA